MGSSPSERLAVLEGGGPTSEDLVSMVRLEDAVIGESILPGGTSLDFEATNVRSERTGVHAKVTISSGEAELAYSVFNVDRDEDRTRLANSAAKRMGDSKRWGDAVKLRLDQFTRAIWGHWTASGGPVRFSGDGHTPAGFLLEPYVVEGGITMLYGPPKSGKSFVGLIWALTVTHGVNAWGGEGITAPVAFVNLERPPSTVGYRLNRLANALGCPNWLHIQHEKGRRFSDVAPATLHWLKDHPDALVIVDSLSRMGSGDLNSNEDTNRAMDLLHGLKASVVVLAHTPRSDSSHVFGSVMHEAAADVLVRCEKAKGEAPGLMGVRLTVDDGNDVGWAPAKTWAFEFSKEAGLERIRPALPDDFPDLSDVRPIRERARDFLSVVRDATTKEIADELDLPLDSVSKALRRETATFLAAIPGGKGAGSKTCWTLVPRQEEESRDY